MSQSSKAEGEQSARVWVYPLATVAGWAVLVAVVLSFFDAFRFVFLGFLGACTLASALRPLRDKMPGPLGLRAVLSGLIPIVLAVVILSLLSYFLATRIQEEVGKWPETRESINQLLANVSQRLGLETTVSVDTVGNQLIDYFSGRGGAEIASATANTVSKTMIGLAFLFFGTIYLLLGRRENLLHPALLPFSPRRRGQLAAAVNDLEVRLRWWTLGVVLSMAIVGSVTGIGFTIIGLQMAIPLALLAGVAEIVPTLGPLFAFLLALLLAATQGTTTVIAVVALYLFVQILESYVILPLVMKRAVHMPPVVTLFTVVLWGRVLGPGGLLLALPLNLAIISFADRLFRRRD